MRQCSLNTFICLTIFIQGSKSSFVSHLTESLIAVDSGEICFKNHHDTEEAGGAAQMTHFKRQHRTARRLKEPQVAGDLKLTELESSLLDKLYEYPVIVPPQAIQSGISNLGDMQPLEKFINKLVSGKPVRIAALGGSVTVGTGIENYKSVWLPRFFEWINTTFPNPQHAFYNKAIAAVTSTYFAPCLEDILPKDLDLLLLEIAYNDNYRADASSMVDTTRIGMEKLLRKIMAPENSPAVLNFHYHPFQHTTVLPRWYSGSEAWTETLMKYYDIPSISLRSALHRMLDHDKTLMNQLWSLYDTVHPTCLGHKFMSDLVIGFFQDITALVLSTLHEQEPITVSAWGNDLPPQLLGSTSTQPSLDRCFLKDDFKALATNLMGYEWINEAKKPGQEKFGFVSPKVGDSMVLKVPVESIASSLLERQFLVAVGVLVSYEHMGFLNMSCQAGCTCDSKEADGRLDMPYSLVYWKGTVATLDIGSLTCDIAIESLNKTATGEYKTKVTSLLISSDIVGFSGWWEND